MVTVTRSDRDGRTTINDQALKPEYLNENLPCYHCDEFREVLPLLNVSQDIYEGQTRWIKDGMITDFSRAYKYLPKEEAEGGIPYANRLLRSLFSNFYQPTIQGFAGLLSQYQLTAEVPESIRENLKNINLQGANLRAFLSDLDEVSMRDGFVGVLVEYPKRPEIRSREEEQRIGLRPYFCKIERRDIINWSVSYGLDGALRLDMVVIRRKIARQKGTYGRECVEQFWVMQPGEYQIYEINGEGSDKAAVPIGDPVEVFNAKGDRLSYIPLVFYPIDKQDPFHLHPPLYDLALTNISHYQIYSEYREVLYKCNLPVPVRKGMPQGDLQAPLTIGPNSVVDVPEDGDFYFAEPTGSAIASTRTAIVDLETNMLRRSLSFFGQTGGMTNEEATLRSTQTKSTLTQMATDKESSVEQMFQIWSDWTGEGTGGGIVIDKSLLRSPLSAQAIQIYSSLVTQGQIDYQTFYEILKEGQALPEQIDVLTVMERSGRVRLDEDV